MKKPILFIICFLCLLSCAVVNAPIHSDVKSLLSYQEFLDIFFKDNNGYEITERTTEELEFAFGERNIIYGTWEVKYGETKSCIFDNNSSFFHQLEGVYSQKRETMFQNKGIRSIALNNLSQIDFIGKTYGNHIKTIKAYDHYIEQHYKEIYGANFFQLNTPIQDLFQHKNLLFLSVESSNKDADKILIESIPHVNAIVFKDNVKIDIFGCNDTIKKLENFLQYCTFIVDGKKITTEYLLKHKEKNLLVLFKEEVMKMML